MATSTQLISGVDFIAVPVKDYEAAARFYGEVLGLPFGKRWGEMPAGEFETGFRDPDGNSLAIHHRYAPGAAPEEALDAAIETAPK
jgi:catechol 2,3-dioxygenase-like lactoylglutathione lyase family enzyme